MKVHLVRELAYPVKGATVTTLQEIEAEITVKAWPDPPIQHATGDPYSPLVGSWRVVFLPPEERT